MTPFIDVMLVLLIIFMVAMPKLEAPLDVGGTGAPKPMDANPEPVTVALVTEAGNVTFMRGDARGEAHFGQLDANITAFGRPKDGKVYLRAEDCAAYGRYFRVLAELQRAGLEPIVVAGRQLKPDQSPTSGTGCPKQPENTARGD